MNSAESGVLCCSLTVRKEMTFSLSNYRVFIDSPIIDFREERTERNQIVLFNGAFEFTEQMDRSTETVTTDFLRIQES